jgi:acyl-CoA thioesterase-2
MHADSPVGYLLSLLDLDQLDDDTFRGATGEGGYRLFGGQVAAQALRAAQRTVAVDHRVNSLHAYFLRPGRYGPPTEFAVDRIRDGSSFTTRRVVARQEGEAILSLDASFHRAEPGDDYQPPSIVGAAAPPDTAPPPRFDPPGARPHRRPFVRREALLRSDPEPALAVWVRAADQLPDDDAVHACIVTYFTDMGPIGAVRRRLGWSFTMGMAASLDHCLWFHRPVRADQWLLYRLEALAAAGARGAARGDVWTEDGTLVASVVQEGLIRPPRDRNRPRG